MSVKSKSPKKQYPKYPKVVTTELRAARRALMRLVPEPTRRLELLERWRRLQMQRVARVGLKVITAVKETLRLRREKARVSDRKNATGDTLH